MIYKVTVHISTLYIPNFINSRITYTSRYARKKEENLLHDFILYTQETSHTKWKVNIAYWGVSMKINNENENYILHLIFHTLRSTYQIIKDPCNGK